MEQEYLKDELSGLLRYIQRVRTEIAAISRPADEDFKFESMGEQLGAIVKATETATNTIIAAMERNDDIIENIRAKKKSKKLQELCDQLIENDNEVFRSLLVSRHHRPTDQQGGQIDHLCGRPGDRSGRCLGQGRIG